MVTVQVKLSVDDIIASLNELNGDERERLQQALANLQHDAELQKAINEGLEDVKYGRVTDHESVMNEIKTKYNYRND